MTGKGEKAETASSTLYVPHPQQTEAKLGPFLVAFLLGTVPQEVMCQSLISALWSC